MCGIAGIIGQVNDNNYILIKNMISSLYHRGPDKMKVLETSDSLLAFSRLKIIDFDDRSMQLMISDDKKHILLFNGEIYNYKELKKNIGKKYPFKTSSDTEVLLAMLKIHGMSALKYLNGMFAFCYYNVIENSYVLARDRFGQKPLYYSISKNSFYFASEIKSLISSNVDVSADFASISEYLHKGELDFTKHTWFNNIKQIEAGQYIKIKSNKIINTVNWYNLEKIKSIDMPKNLDEKNEFINQTFLKVCDEHLNADTKIGVKLSGGLDSSTMLASMEKNKKYYSNQCFSVDFGSSYSEKEWITETANFFNKDVIISNYKIENFLSDFNKMIFTHEGPLGGLMNCAFEKVYQSANKSNIRVLLDGTGLDEAFGGYRIHHMLFLYKMYKKKDTNFHKFLNEYSMKWKIKQEEVKTELLKLSKNSNYVQDGSSFDQNKFTTKYIQDLSRSNFNTNLNNIDSIHKHFIDYIVRSKIPKNTRIKDRQSMSYSIELRMPFLDQRIIELGLSLKEEEYFAGGLTKNIIRNIMKNKLPDKVRLDQKRSIQAPQGAWLRHPIIIKYVKDLIYSDSFKSRGIFNYKKVKKNYEDFIEFGAENSFHIWQWINIEVFFNTFFDKKLKTRSADKIEFTKLNNC